MKHKKIYYHWGYDTMWVMEDPENEDKSEKYSMDSYDVLERVNNPILAAGQMLYFLLYNGIEVDIIDDPFKNAGGKKEFMDQLRRQVSMGI